MPHSPSLGCNVRCKDQTVRRRFRRSGFPRSRLRGSGHRRGSPFRTSRSSSITSALILLRQRANVSPVAPAARSSFHRARIAAISSTSGRSIFVFVMASSIGGRPLKTRCLFGGEQVRWSSTPIPPSLKVLYVDQVVLTFRIINHKWCWPISCPYRSSPASIPLNWRLGRLWGGFPFALRFSHKLPVGRYHQTKQRFFPGLHSCAARGIGARTTLDALWIND